MFGVCSIVLMSNPRIFRRILPIWRGRLLPPLLARNLEAEYNINNQNVCSVFFRTRVHYRRC